MGFTTAFIGSITLTSSVLYLSLATHRKNRLEQSLNLRQSALQLRRIIDLSETSIAIVPYQSRANWNEVAKTKWNSELEGLVKRLRNVDWMRLRERLEDGIARTWGEASQQVERSSKDL